MVLMNQFCKFFQNKTVNPDCRQTGAICIQPWGKPGKVQLISCQDNRELLVKWEVADIPIILK
jgi:hypothetical protein